MKLETRKKVDGLEGHFRNSLVFAYCPRCGTAVYQGTVGPSIIFVDNPEVLHYCGIDRAEALLAELSGS